METKSNSVNVFGKLATVDCAGKVESKNGLKYLSWVYAWGETLKRFPTATYSIYRGENGLPYVWDENTGYMVFTSVTIEGLTHEMWLPVMDGANKAMLDKPYTYKVKDWQQSKIAGKTVYIDKEVAAATMFDVNKTIMRCLVKNLAMFGLGLNIYAGEDLPTVQPLPTASDVAGWIAKGKSKDDCIAYIEKLAEETGQVLTQEYRESIDRV